MKGLTGFLDSSEKDAALGAVGAIVGLFAIPYTPQVFGAFTNLAVGIVLVVAGMHVKYDGLSEVLMGAGIIYAIDGAVRMLIPATRTQPSFAGSMVMPVTVNNYAKLA